MRINNKIDPKTVLKPSYFINWGDLWYPKLANLLLIPATKFPKLTPNKVTISSFACYLIATIFIAFSSGWFWIAAAVLLPISYILDCLDGQLARFTNQGTTAGLFLDKTLDIVKLGAINLSMGYAAYNMTNRPIFLILGFLSCFGFLFRFYIKLETMFDAILRDKDYLEKSRIRRANLNSELEKKRLAPKDFTQKIKWQWLIHHSAFALDEAEHVSFGAILIALQRPDLWCWLFGIGQIIIVTIRFIQRGNQLVNNPDSLTFPLRK